MALVRVPGVMAPWARWNRVHAKGDVKAGVRMLLVTKEGSERFVDRVDRMRSVLEGAADLPPCSA